MKLLNQNEISIKSFIYVHHRFAVQLDGELNYICIDACLKYDATNSTWRQYICTMLQEKTHCWLEEWRWNRLIWNFDEWIRWNVFIFQISSASWGLRRLYYSFNRIRAHIWLSKVLISNFWISAIKESKMITNPELAQIDFHSRRAFTQRNDKYVYFWYRYAIPNFWVQYKIENIFKCLIITANILA